MVSVPTGLVSADSHVVEPDDLFTTRMDRRWRDRAPHVECRPDGDWYVIDGLRPFPIGFLGACLEDKLRNGSCQSGSAHRSADTRRGAWDPEARLQDQDVDGLSAEVIYPGASLFFFHLTDAEYEAACVRTYNDWIAEFCNAAPDRLIGAGMVPIAGDVASAIAEAERIAELGLRTVILPADLHGDQWTGEWWSTMFDALDRIGLPLGFHVGTSTGEPFFMKVRRVGIGPALVEDKFTSGIEALSRLIWDGVAQRWPTLRFVIVEGGAGWVPSLLGTMDHWWEDHHRWMRPSLEQPPSVFFKRQFWVTFEDDRDAVLGRELIGADRIMWGSDYPHTEGTFPNSRAHVAKDMGGVPVDEVEAMVRDNARSLYGIGR